MSLRLFIGIDPGIRGAVGVLTGDHQDPFVDVFDMPIQTKRSGRNEVDPLALWDRLCAVTQPYVSLERLFVVEQVSAMPGQGVSGMFSLGDSYGCARTIATIHGRATGVSPVTWKKAMKLTKNKSYSLTLARRAFPSAAKHLTRVKDEGRAEALLLAQYAMRNADTLF